MSTLNEQDVREALRSVIDPELGMNLIDLGMVKQIAIADGQVAVQLVLTAPGCPLAGWIVRQVQQTVSTLPEVKHVESRCSTSRGSCQTPPIGRAGLIRRLSGDAGLWR